MVYLIIEVGNITVDHILVVSTDFFGVLPEIIPINAFIVKAGCSRAKPVTEDLTGPSTTILNLLPMLMNKCGQDQTVLWIQLRRMTKRQLILGHNEPQTWPWWEVLYLPRRQALHKVFSLDLRRDNLRRRREEVAV